MLCLNLHIWIKWLGVLSYLVSILEKCYLNNFNWVNSKSIKNGRIHAKSCAYVHSKHTYTHIHMHALLKSALSAHCTYKYELYPEKLCDEM